MMTLAARYYPPSHCSAALPPRNVKFAIAAFNPANDVVVNRVRAITSGIDLIEQRIGSK